MTAATPRAAAITLVQAYYSVRPCPQTPGRWLVVHRVPGTMDTWASDASCPTYQAAAREAAWLEAERSMAAHWHRHEQQLTGVRP